MLGAEGVAMESIEFRTAVAADLADIVALLADDELGRSRESAGLPLDQRYLSAFAAIEVDANQQLVVAIAGAQVVGTLQLSFIPGIARRGAWRGLIEGVRIAAPYRSAGIGQKMFEWAIARCKDKGCNLVQLTTDKTRPDAHRFYERLGFENTHEGYKLIFQA
jgi:GNAT superfamily N-acetyltransferase